MSVRKGFATALLASMALFGAACGSDDDEGDSGSTSSGSTAAESTGATEGAKAAPALDAASAKGNVTYCTGASSR